MNKKDGSITASSWKKVEASYKTCEAINKELEKELKAGLTPEEASEIIKGTNHIHVVEGVVHLITGAELGKIAAMKLSGGVILTVIQAMISKTDVPEDQLTSLLMGGKIPALFASTVFGRLDFPKLQEIMTGVEAVAKKLGKPVKDVKADIYNAIKDPNILSLYLAGESDEELQKVIKARIAKLDK